MKTDACLSLLATLLDSAAITVPELSALGRSAAAVLVMARAYESDGKTFFISGDRVNALASAFYGSGWLHFGISYGLLDTSLPAGCPFLNRCEHLPQSFAGKLDEKARRYERLLNTARSSVKCTGETATISHEFSQKVLFVSALYSGQGRVYLQKGNNEDALACFSYGHGWLDAGVTTGLFEITKERDIFTI
jgi:uncharacterized protein